MEQIKKTVSLELVEPCGVTMNIDYVCGCDDVTYVNPSAAECHQIYTYTEGVCDERSVILSEGLKFYDEQYVTTPYGDSMNAERRALWTLAIPVIMTNGAMMSLGVVDMIMVGRLGSTAIASLSVSVTWMFAIGVFGRNIPAGVEPLVSQAAGEKQTEIRAELFQHLLRLMVIVLIPQTFLYLNAESSLLLFGQQPEVASLAGSYCAVLALAVPAELAFIYAMRFFQAMERVQSATISVIAANILNVMPIFSFLN